MKNGYSRSSVVMSFLMLLMALITNAWITRRQLGVQIHNQAEVADSRESLFDLAQIELALNEAETGQRGFLYTGDPKYLAPYNLAGSQVATHISHLERLAVDKPNLQSQVPLLRSLIHEKFGELSRTVSLFQSGKTDEAKALVLSDTGLLMMDRIRNLIREMGQGESSLLISQSAAYMQSKKVTIACIYITNLVAVLALMMLAYHVHRQMKAREADARKIQTREEELRQREALLRTVTDHSHVGLTMLGADRCYLYSNSAYEKLFELSPGDLGGRRASDVLGQIYEQISPWLDRAFCGERVNFEISVPTPPQKAVEPLGRSYAISYQPLQTYGEPLRVIGVTIDVTAHKRSQEIVRMNEERLRLAQLAAGLGTFDVELPSGEQKWSVPMLELFGLAGDAPPPVKSELLGMCHPDDRPLASDQLSLMASGKRIHVAFRIIRPNGETRWIEAFGTSVFNDAGLATRCVGVASDITERRQAEDTLRRSQEQLRALSARLQTATERERLRIARELHDQFGQVLTGLKMDLDWIVRKHGAAGGIWVSLVQDSIKIVDSTIGLVRRLATELRPEILDAFGLRAAVRWHTEQFQQRTGTLCAVVVPDQPLGLADEQKIAVFRIFQEALTNIARHAIAKNVLVTLEIERNEVILSVNDDGVGFVVDTLEVAGSLGILGMRERALILNGDFLLQSEPGHGTTVTLRIPLEEACGAEPAAYEHIDS